MSSHTSTSPSSTRAVLPRSPSRARPPKHIMDQHPDAIGAYVPPTPHQDRHRPFGGGIVNSRDRPGIDEETGGASGCITYYDNDNLVQETGPRPKEGDLYMETTTGGKVERERVVEVVLSRCGTTAVIMTAVLPISIS